MGTLGSCVRLSPNCTSSCRGISPLQAGFVLLKMEFNHTESTGSYISEVINHVCTVFVLCIYLASDVSLHTSPVLFHLLFATKRPGSCCLYLTNEETKAWVDQVMYSKSHDLKMAVEI